jgi:hypothetical protein
MLSFWLFATYHFMSLPSKFTIDCYCHANIFALNNIFVKYDHMKIKKKKRKEKNVWKKGQQKKKEKRLYCKGKMRDLSSIYKVNVLLVYHQAKYNSFLQSFSV